MLQDHRDQLHGTHSGPNRDILSTKMHPCVCSVAQSCLILCNSMDCSLPGSSVHGISRQEYWSGSPFSPSGALPYPGMASVSLMSPTSQADSLALSRLGSPNAPITFPKYSCGLCTPLAPESHYAPIIRAVCPCNRIIFFFFYLEYSMECNSRN